MRTDAAGFLEPDDVLGYWVGPAQDDPAVAQAKSALWFRKSFETDREIASHFLPTMAALASGLAHDWAQAGPRGRLAAIIALDQFSRNVFRGMPAAFENDALALSLALGGMVTRQDQGFTEVERLFFFLPLEHAEDRDMQTRCVSAMAHTADTARPGFEELATGWLDYAQRHKAVIDRFGRFPHRNAILGRRSTPEEEAFLREPGSGF